MERTKTELHTHLMGMLTAESFLVFLIQNNVEYIYWPLDEPVDEKTKYIKVIDILANPKLFEEAMNKLSIPRGTTVKYESLSPYYQTRRTLIKYAITKQPDYQTNLKAAKTRVYNNYINSALRELVSQGVEYVEISYSIRQILLNFEIDDDIKDQIKCKFLLSTDRNNPLENFVSSAKDLKKVINKGIAVGFDIMGEERKLSLEELDYSDDSKESRSFKRKLEAILSTLTKCPSSTLRIHSGETKESNINTEITLSMLESIAEEQNIEIPPPEIRIGHGIHFHKNRNYIRLLKKFKCIIEINASSNIALSNATAVAEIPYEFYLKEGIPLVIATDGHGLYDTTIKREDIIANAVIGDVQYGAITAIDKVLLSSKKGR